MSRSPPLTERSNPSDESQEKRRRVGVFDTNSEECDSTSVLTHGSLNTIVGDDVSVKSLQQSLEFLKAVNLQSIQMMANAMKSKAPTATPEDISTVASPAYFSRPRNQQPTPLIRHWEVIRHEWAEATMEEQRLQVEAENYISVVHDLYTSNTQVLRNLHDSYCAMLSCSKTVDLFLNPDLDMAQQIIPLIDQLKDETEKQIIAVNDLEEKRILSVDDLLQLDNLKQRLIARKDVLNVYQTDWKVFVGSTLPSVTSMPFSLALLEQPMSYVLPPHDRAKKPVLEGPFRLQFFAGPSQKYFIEGNCVSAVVCYEERGKAEFLTMDHIAGAEPLIQSQDSASFVATFPKFDIDISGKRQFNITFFVNVHHFKSEDDVNPEIFRISIMSNTYSNTVHQDQWCLEAGRLVLKSVFDTSKDSAPWPFFCNRLQLHFLKESRQNLSMREGRRALTLQDLRYLKKFQRERRNEMHLNSFWGATRSQPAAPHSFWHWFGSILATLRFKKSVIHMWSKGYILGFCKKDEAESLLRSRDGTYANPGTFLVRFSESNPGLFACVFVAYPDSKIVKDEQERTTRTVNLCKHIVIEDSELNQNTSLADYLVSNRTLELLLHLDQDSNIYTSNSEDILQAYLAKRKPHRVQGEIYLNARAR